MMNIKTDIPDFRIEGIAPMLYVFDMPASLRFYRDILGFSVVMSSEPNDETNWVLLKLNGAELMLNTALFTPTISELPRTRIPVCTLAARILMGYTRILSKTVSN
ncbi:MAG: VOC family protein [Mucilaginibacter sp.]